METTTHKTQTQKLPSKSTPPELKQLIESGIPLRKVVFGRTVIFEGQNATPEFAFYDPNHSQGSIANRKAKLWYTPHGVICEQRGVYKLVPLSNVIDTIV